jgi:WD40 repeat protein
MFEALSGMGIWTNSAARAQDTRSRVKAKVQIKDEKKVGADSHRAKRRDSSFVSNRPLRERTNQQEENLAAPDPVTAFRKYRSGADADVPNEKAVGRKTARPYKSTADLFSPNELAGNSGARAMENQPGLSKKLPSGAAFAVEELRPEKDTASRLEQGLAFTEGKDSDRRDITLGSPAEDSENGAGSPGWLGTAKHAASDGVDQTSPLSRLLHSQELGGPRWEVTNGQADGSRAGAEECPQGPLAAPSPLQRRLMRMSPNMHIVSLENIARLYLELQADREYLVRESEKCYRARASTIQDLREVEAALAELLTKKHALEEKLESLGERDELSRLLLGNLDEKVTVIGSESVAFEERIRQLKGSGVAQAVERAARERRGRSSLISAASNIPNGHNKELTSSSRADVPEKFSATANIGPVQENGYRATKEHEGAPVAPRLCIRTLYGHTGQVLAVDVHEEADIIVSASADRTLRIWDLSVCMSLDESFVDAKDPFGSRKDTLHGHEGWVHALDIHPTGTLLVSGSADRTARLWKLYDADESASSPVTSMPHARRHRCLHVFAGAHRGAITAIQMDDSRMITGSADHTLVCWDLETRSRLLRMEGHEAGVAALQFWRYGLATGSGDGTVRMWDMRTGRCHRTLPVTHSADGEATQAAVTCLQFDESRLLTGSTDECVRLWDLRTAKCLHVLETGSSVHALRFDRDRLYVGCTDQVVRAYDMHQLLEPPQGRPSMLRRAFFGHTGAVHCLALSEYGLVSGAADQTLRLWNTHWNEDLHVSPE